MNQKRTTISRLRQVSVLAAVACLIGFAFLFSCGRGGGSSGTQTRSPSATTQPRHFDLNVALAEIDAYPTPNGIDPARFLVLKEELKRLLKARASGKTVSSTSSLPEDSVTDLVPQSNQAQTQATLTWSEKLAGDYNNDGEVFITDIEPIALYEGHSILEWIDGGRDALYRQQRWRSLRCRPVSTAFGSQVAFGIAQGAVEGPPLPFASIPPI